jgi:hypothetical protein
MTDTCATHDEGTENLFDHSEIIGLYKRLEERASTWASILSSSDEVSGDTSKILARNEAWLEKRCHARNDLGLVVAYAKLIWMCKKQRSTTLHKHIPMWKSYFERRLETYHSDPYWGIWKVAPLPIRSFLLHLIEQTFGPVMTSLPDYWLIDTYERCRKHPCIVRAPLSQNVK